MWSKIVSVIHLSGGPKIDRLYGKEWLSIGAFGIRGIGLLLYSYAYVSRGILNRLASSQKAIVLRLSLVQSLQLIESEMPIRDPIVCTIQVGLYFHNVAMS